VNEILECSNCSSSYLTTQTESFQYFKDTNMCCLGMVCEDCKEKLIVYLEIKMIIKSKRTL